jgi:hypothetical protein
MAVTLVLAGTSTALVILLLAEFALRMTHPNRVLAIARERERIANLAYVFQPDYLIALRPDVEKTYPLHREDGEESIPWKTNRDGFRGEPLREHPAARIIVYGDSNIQAPFSRLEDTFPSKLEQYLAQLTGVDIEVVNGGVVGSGPDQSLMRFSAQFDKFRPDLVVFHVYADNDFGDIVRNRIVELNSQNELVPTGFRATVDSELKSRKPRLLLVLEARRAMRRLFADGVSAGPTSDSETGAAELSQEARLQELLKQSAAEYATYKKGGRRAFSNFADHYDIDIALHPNAESSRVKIALMEAVLRDVKRTAAEKGVALLVLIQPSAVDITQADPILTSACLSRFDDYRKDRLASIVDEICARNQIDRINLFPIFARNNPDSLYFHVADDHWNEAGQDLAARETANHIHASLPRLGKR